MRSDKISNLNAIVIVVCSFLVIFSLIGVIDCMNRNNYIVHMVGYASFFVVGSIGLLIQVLIANLKVNKT